MLWHHRKALMIDSKAASVQLALSLRNDFIHIFTESEMGASKSLQALHAN